MMATFKPGEHAVLVNLRRNHPLNGLVVEVLGKTMMVWNRWGNPNGPISPRRAYPVRLPYPAGPQAQINAYALPWYLRKLLPPPPLEREQKKAEREVENA